MSANVETMFYAGETPWHNMGVSVEEALTSADAIHMAGLDWDVEQKKIQVCDGKSIPGYKANVRSSDGKVLGLVTDRYKIVQNSEAFAFTDCLLGEGVKYETAGSLSNGKRVWMLAKMDTTKILGDDVEPYLVFTNSHDGTGAVKVALTPVRVVCQNTLTFALSTAKRTWSTRHCGDINSKMEEARNTLELAAKYMDGMAEYADKATQITVISPQFLDFLTTMFPISDDMTDLKKQRIEAKRNALKSIYESKEDIKKFNGTAYGVLQAVADFVPHYVPDRKTSTYQENNFMSIVDGGKNNLMDMACNYFSVT